MSNTPFKMRGFSGFGNSPLQKDKKQTATEKLVSSKKRGGWKGYLKTIVQDPTLLPKTFGESLKHTWKKHGPVINPSTKNPRGIGK